MPKKATEKDTKNPREKIVNAALGLASEQGWAEVSLHDIAKKAGMSLTTLHDYLEDKDDVLVLLGRMIDRKVLENMEESDAELPVRDRLFDVLMERFEIMGEYREGLVAILNAFRFDPKQAVIACPHLCRSMTWMLEAAGLQTGGWRGAVKVLGLSGVYLNVLRTWMEDESEDLSKTMAALDKNLSRADQVAGTLEL